MQSINQSTNQNRDDRLKRKGEEERRREKRKGEGKRGKGKEKEGREREKGEGKLKKREGREEEKGKKKEREEKERKRKKKEGKKVSQFFSLRIGSHKKLSKIFFWEKYDIFSPKAKGKGKKGEEGSNYEKGGKRGNFIFLF